MSNSIPGNNLNGAIAAKLAGLKPSPPPPKPEPPPPAFEEKFEKFNNDLEVAARLKGAAPPPLPSFGGVPGLPPLVGPTDIAPKESGDVNVPGVASLKQTAEGCCLQVSRMGFLGVAGTTSTYVYDQAKGTVQVEEIRDPVYSPMMMGLNSGYAPYGLGMTPGFVNTPMLSVPGQRETYTLDLNEKTVKDYKQEGGWNLST